jgi:hypothetical protein
MSRAEDENPFPSRQLAHTSVIEKPIPCTAVEASCTVGGEPSNAVSGGQGALAADIGCSAVSVEFSKPSVAAAHRSRARSLTTEDGYTSPLEDDHWQDAPADDTEDDETIPAIPDTWFLRHQHLVRWQSLAIPFACLTVLQILGSSASVFVSLACIT